MVPLPCYIRTLTPLGPMRLASRASTTTYARNMGGGGGGGGGKGVIPIRWLTWPLPDPPFVCLDFLGIPPFIQATLHPMGSYSASVH